MDTPNDPHLWMHGKYPHLRIPKELFWSPTYNWLSPEEKLVYGAFMDRTSLSTKNKHNYTNESGEIFIYFPLSQIQDLMQCGHDKASKILSNLVKAELIKLSRIGCGRPYQIVVIPKNWETPSQKSADTPQMPQPEPDTPKPENPEPDNIMPGSLAKQWTQAYIKYYFHYDSLKEYYSTALLDRTMLAMENVCASPQPYTRVGDMDLTTEYVCSAIQRINTEQFGQVLRRLQLHTLSAPPSEAEILDVLCSVYREGYYE